MAESFWEYVKRFAPYAENRKIANKIGVDSSAISRWKTGETPAFKNAIAFARAYDRPAIEALIAAGYLNPSDAVAEVVVVDLSVSELADEVLLEQLTSRLKVTESTRAQNTVDGFREALAVVDPAALTDADRRALLRLVQASMEAAGIE